VLRYSARIEGRPNGTLGFAAKAVPEDDFPTNRTGFVVLHPAEAAGGRLSIRHSDGQVEETVFPEAISPDQPAFDIAALTHEPAPGLTCTVAMEGDAFEMEDQRNWSDASFKTYIRPLSKPRPYVIPAGAGDVQRITITVEETGGSRARRPKEEGIRLELGAPIARMPRITLMFEGEDVLGRAPIRAQTLLVRFDQKDPRAGARLGGAARLAAGIGAEPAVEGIFDCLDPASEARSLLAALGDAGLRPAAVLVSPRREFRTRPSNTLPAGEHPVDAVVAALRQAGFAGPVGAGTPSFFTEFNRNPPGDAADFVHFGIAGNVHAADDLSVMETLTVHPAIVQSARALCPGKPIWLGPCTIGMPHNPYGAGTAANPGRVRMPATRDDPRHAALFGAAFAAGVAAQAAAAQVDHLTLAAIGGPFGLLDTEGRPLPIHAVHALLAAAAGRTCRHVGVDSPAVAALAFDGEDGLGLLVANLTPEPVQVHLPDGLGAQGEVMDVVAGRRLDLAPALTLSPYRVVLSTGRAVD
jgi:hypothetical protein